MRGARLAEKRDAEQFCERERGQTARRGQHADGHRDDGLQQRRGDRKDADKTLKDEPLGRESGQRRQCRGGATADEDERRAEGQNACEAAQMFEVGRLRRLGNGSGREEEQALERSVADDVKEQRDQGQR
jgi:hypothetical protein